jgi:NitT/TauT family transport system substrate-binding protein
MAGKPQNRIQHLPVSLPFLLIFAMIVPLTGCGGKPVALEPLRIGMEATAVNSLIYLAQDQGFFDDHGIDLILNDTYTSGAAAAEAMLRGELDIATATEFAVVRQALSGGDITTLGSIDMFTHMKLVARKDRGILTAFDLVGKKVGVPFGSAAEFMLGRFLALAGISPDRITLVDVQAPQATSSLVEGSVDAVVAWQPNIMAMLDQLGDKASVFQVQSGQSLYCAVVTTDAWAGSNPRILEAFLAAMADAETYLIGNAASGKSKVQMRLGYDDRYMGQIWPEHRLTLRLDQSLVLAMEDQARWLISSGLTAAKIMPDFMEYIYEEPIKNVKPGAVNIIR